jgi:hypothetical protein
MGSNSDSVLNPRLHAALTALFHQVEVTARGEQVNLTEEVADTPILRRRGLKISSKTVKCGERYAVNCPFCKDRYGRLNISYAWGMHTEINGMPVQFPQSLAICYNENCLSVPDNWLHLVRMIENAMGNEPAVVSLEDVLPPPPRKQAQMPGGILVNDPALPQYIRDYLVQERRCDLDELAGTYRVQVSVISQYDNPVLVFPVYQQNRLDLWQARYIGKCLETDRHGKPKSKYWTGPGTQKSSVLYNLDQAQTQPLVVLVEGVFDAIRVGPAGVAMFGKKPSTTQQRMLHALWRRGTLFWIPDQDDPGAFDIAMGFIDQWNANGWFAGGAHAVTLPAGTDPADCTREGLWELINNSK